MSSFTNKPALMPLPDGESWKLQENFEYHVGSEDNSEVIEIPKGFVTDGASIPRFLWPIIGHPWGRYAYAAIVHDWLYHKHRYTRKRSDQIFLEAMAVLKVPKWKRNTMYTFVRMFSWLFWNKRKPLIAATIVCAFLLAGCASMDLRFNDQGRIQGVDSTGVQDTKVSQKTIEEGVTEVTKDGVTTRTVDKVTKEVTVERKAAFEIWPTNLFTIVK